MEEKKEKKTIKCSYAVLVIALCATVAFLTDYIIIDRKTKNCDCSRCEATNNEVISENIENKDNIRFAENNGNVKDIYKAIAGHYSYNDDIGKQEFYFYENGTMIYYYEENELNPGGFNGGSGGYLGYYSIDDNKIKTAVIFEYYDEAGKLYYKPSTLYSGGNRFGILNENELYSLSGADWKYQRVNDEYFDSDQYAERIASSEIIYGSELHSGEPRSQKLNYKVNVIVVSFFYCIILDNICYMCVVLIQKHNLINVPRETKNGEKIVMNNL